MSWLDEMFGGRGRVLANSNAGQSVYTMGLGTQNMNGLRPYRYSVRDALREAKSLLYEAHCRAKEEGHPLTEDIWRTFNDAEAIWLEDKWIEEQERLRMDAALTAEYGPEIKP